MSSSKSMKSSHKRRKRSANRSGESLWKDVTVALGEEQEKYILDQNHYDNEDSDDDGDHKKKKRQRLGKASLDLPVQPGEDIGMMYGLQVLSGDDYTVDPQTRQLQILSASTDDDNTEGEPTPTTNESTTASTTEQPTKKTKKKKSKKDNGEKVSSTTTEDTPSPAGDATTKTSKTRTKKDTKSSTNSQMDDDQDENDVATKQKQSQNTVTEEDSSSLDWQTVQQAWSVACGGAVLRESLCRALAKQGFGQPTPIQAATLSASILGRRNLVGAAPTGSGKTLAFLLPILQALLDDDDDDDDDDEARNKKIVRALIVTPTRELATQIYQECEVLAPRQCVTLVGGIAPVKQARLLQTIRPSILVGTPGRLWQMISSQEHDHLRDLSQVQFLVLDEADRLTQDHSFPQMVEILERIHLENKGPFEGDDESDDESSDSDDEDRMLGLPGIRGESATTMLTPEILRQIQEQRETMPRPGGRKVKESNEDLEHDDSDNEEDLIIEPVEETEEEDFDEVFHVRDGDGENDDDGPPLVHRQTFIYSATLTLPYTSTKATASSQQKKKKNSKQQRKLPLEGGLAEILEKTHAMGETKVVDLSSSNKTETSQSNSNSNSNSDANGVKLPPGLKLEQIKCTQRHKDSHLYAYLMTTAQGASGPALVFCNSIAAVRRVGTTLQMLGLSVRILHAHMQQRARFKAVESLSKGAFDDGSSSSRVVVVCTDVAARGLDIPSVSTVIHYDVARAVDTFVHRAGRTARGMGKGAIGTSLSLIGPSEDKAHGKICERVVRGGGGFGKVNMDGRLLTQAQERVNLACKVVEAESQQKQVASQNAWFLEKAQEGDLILDDDLLMEDDEEDQDPKRKEAAKARQRLQQLLAQPMKTQRFGKFLSTNSAALQDEIQSLSAASKRPTPSARSNGKRKRKKQPKGNA